MLNRFENEQRELVSQHAAIKAVQSPKSRHINFVVEIFKSFNKLYKTANYDLKRLLLGSIFTEPLFFQMGFFEPPK